MITQTPPVGAAGSATPRPPARTADADAAAAFETAFVAEMLHAAKLVREPEGFGGGFGAEMFSSLLNRAYAEQLGKAGGLGLAETIRDRIGRDGA
ncbi:rod-binding protein [Marinivivus vitaminiproducens]|uniref:rod-binding protein n=1 Tax=Marinivivus vitaminiproducens TaxID=3035935 RepID=UPI0027A32C20|nr:rod-binding protein [Geminicoccaceae bacterium SCSIO 64248]